MAYNPKEFKKYPDIMKLREMLVVRVSTQCLEKQNK